MASGQQPPPRGCVLKQVIAVDGFPQESAAASARLCVETLFTFYVCLFAIAAASARLCVETWYANSLRITNSRSRLRAAVC